MRPGKRGRGRKSSPKQSLNLPDLDQARSEVLNSLPSKESQRGYMRLTSSLAGIAPNPDFPSTKLSSPAIGFTWSHGSWRRARLNGRLAPSVAWHTKRLIPVCSARILLLASGASKGRRTSAFALVFAARADQAASNLLFLVVPGFKSFAFQTSRWCL